METQHTQQELLERLNKVKGDLNNAPNNLKKAIDVLENLQSNLKNMVKKLDITDISDTEIRVKFANREERDMFKKICT